MNQELTFKELLLAIKSYWTFFISRWYLFLVAIVAFVGLMVFLANKQESLYVAPLTFVVEGSGSGGGGAGGVLGQLGLGNGEQNNNIDRIIQFAYSHQVIAPSIFDSISVDGKNRLLANYLIDLYGYHEKWKESSQLNGFLFDSSSLSTEDAVENRVYKKLHDLIVNNKSNGALLSFSADEMTSIFTLEVTSLDSEVSYTLAENIFKNLENFYIESVVRKKRSTSERLTFRSDSLLTMLQNTEIQLARERDRSSQISLRQNSIRRNRLEREVVLLGSAYKEVLQNRERAAFILENETPSFVVIDMPLKPLRMIEPYLIKFIVIGVLLAVLSVSVILFFYKLINDVMRDAESTQI